MKVPARPGKLPIEPLHSGMLSQYSSNPPHLQRILSVDPWMEKTHFCANSSGDLQVLPSLSALLAEVSEDDRNHMCEHTMYKLVMNGDNCIVEYKDPYEHRRFPHMRPAERERYLHEEMFFRSSGPGMEKERGNFQDMVEIRCTFLGSLMQIQKRRRLS